jgi:hypothetical protein
VNAYFYSFFSAQPGPDSRVETMSLDVLQIIIGTLDPWEKARALLWEQINERLRQHGATAQLAVGRIPARLTLNEALTDLQTAVRWVELTCPRLPPHFPWLLIARGFACPLDSQAAVEHALKAIADLPAPIKIDRKKRSRPDPDFYEREIIRPIEEHAEQIRAWLQDSKERALQKSLTDAERKALRTLRAQRAFDRESRVSIAEIAQRAEGKKWANANPYREAIPSLVEKGFVETKEGCGGGAWLTPDGQAMASSIRRKR